MTLAAAESCTGGLISSAFVDVAGASDVFTAGLVTYKESAKCSLLGVDAEVLAKYSAVSEQTARQMCEKVAQKCGTEVGLSSTGYAGPDGGTALDPVGTVYIGVYIYGKSHVKRLSLDGDRNEIRRKAVNEVILFLKELI
jgi:nicotinamide-nucleotide amidase